mmetsp:Transcript_45966/g.94054  ORF Transcript_45966/g.94054 Transcript_45966/m.94054 type:complete len:267 (+) Transcript_45966:154-954(+)
MCAFSTSMLSLAGDSGISIGSEDSPVSSAGSLLSKCFWASVMALLMIAMLTGVLVRWEDTRRLLARVQAWASRPEPFAEVLMILESTQTRRCSLSSSAVWKALCTGRKRVSSLLLTSWIVSLLGPNPRSAMSLKSATKLPSRFSFMPSYLHKIFDQMTTAGISHGMVNHDSILFPSPPSRSSVTSALIKRVCKNSLCVDDIDFLHPVGKIEEMSVLMNCLFFIFKYFSRATTFASLYSSSSVKPALVCVVKLAPNVFLKTLTCMTA